ncbi:MAG: hypothetical protein WCK53_08960 [Methanomicrobiales archaeon]
MKLSKFGVIALLLFGIVIALTGIVYADQGVPQVPEVQGITTSTVIFCGGTVIDSAALGWSVTGVDNLATRPTIENTSNMLNPQQVQYSTSYDASTIAQHGQTTFIKSMGINTANKLLSQSDVKASTEVTYMATGNGGNIVGSENLMLDGVANTTNATDRILCPFVPSIHSLIPAYCNIVQIGSNYDLTIGSVASTTDERFVGNDASIPVVMNHNINIKPYTVAGQGTSPAMGMTSAFVKAHIQEGRSGNTSKAEDLTYSERSSASGRISAFTKEISYSSQVTSSSAGNHIIHASASNYVPHAFSTSGSAFISPIGDVQVPDQGSITFTVGALFTGQAISVPPDGSAYVVVDGVDQGYLFSYTFSDVTSDHTIVVSPGQPPSP